MPRIREILRLRHNEFARSPVLEARGSSVAPNAVGRGRDRRHEDTPMKCACIALVLGCTLGLPLLGSGASAQGVSITPDNQILVELAPEDTTAANLFDLSGSTLVFTPDGQGAYSRSVQPLAWEEDLGEEISEGERRSRWGSRSSSATERGTRSTSASRARSPSEPRSPTGTTTRPTGSTP